MTEVEHHYSPKQPWESATNNGTDIHEDWESGNNSAKLFERSRIKALAEERQKVQKKTFTKWVNSHLNRVECRIQDLYIDMADGKMLIKLLEVLSGDRLPRPTKGTMRIHCLENVDKALMFLMEQRVHLENVGAHDIVDCNQRLTLGLIWTIILRFQIQDIFFEAEDNEKKSAKDALLLWCQIQTKGYPNVSVRDFSRSWRDGLAFNAIIHKHRPDLIDFKNLKKSNAIQNLNHAFKVASEKLEIDSLLDAEDVNQEVPEERSIMTYVASYYHVFSKMKQDSVQGRRIGKVIDGVRENDNDIQEYENLTSDLLEWIRNTITELNKREFKNTLEGVQKQLSDFNAYRTTEKPPKFVEKGNLEILLFTIQSRQRANNQKPYMPREERMISDINKAWEELERAEHERELKLREELIRQEKLEQLAARFDRKAGLREDWLNENQRLVSQDNFGQDLAAVEAATKKHEAIETDINAYNERVQAVIHVADELQSENYHDIDRIIARKENVQTLWEYLLELLQARRQRLDLTLKLYKIFQEMLYVLDWMDEITARLHSEDYGKHLMGVRDLIQKHELLEADITVVGARVRTINSSANYFVDGEFPQEVGDYRPVDRNVVADRMRYLEQRYAELLQLARGRRSMLGESERLWQFQWDITDETSWITEKYQLMSAEIPEELNLTAALLLKNKHKANENELSARRGHVDGILEGGQKLIDANNLGTDIIRNRIQYVNEEWDDLVKLADTKRQRLDEVVQLNQFASDAEDVNLMLVEMLRKLNSDDVGRDETSAMSLLKKHNADKEELLNYSEVIKALHQQREQLSEKDRDLPQVGDSLRTVDNRYKELIDLADERTQKLNDALALYQLYNEADIVEQWIIEKTKLLSTMDIKPSEMEEVEIIGARFVIFDQELSTAREKVDHVNELAQQLLNNKHPNVEEVEKRRNEVSEMLSELEKIANEKRKQLSGIQSKTTWQIECTETITWIKEKTKVIESTDELTSDLAGIMQLQRRLGGLENDLTAINARLVQLEHDADQLEEDNPEEAELIRAKIDEVKALWQNLNENMQKRDEQLSAASEQRKFLGDLDSFQQWQDKTQARIAREDFPVDVADAERSLASHSEVNDDIEAHAEEHERLVEYGKSMVADMDDDPQYVMLKDRLQGIDEDWENLRRSWKSKQNKLTQNLNYQFFLRDAKQADVLLSQQDNFLSREDVPTSLTAAENLIKKLEQFIATLDANDERINQVLHEAQRLQDENHYASELIKTKADSIDDRRQANRQRANEKLLRLKSQLDLQLHLQEFDELEEWIEEKKTEMDEGELPSVKDRKIIHTKFVKHETHIAEIRTHKTFLAKLIADTEALIEEKPETSETLQPRLDDLKQKWEDLENGAEEKREVLLRAQGPAAVEDTCDDVDAWITNLECQMESELVPEAPLTLNLLIQKQNILESELQLKQQQVDQLQAMQAPLEQCEPDERDRIDKKRAQVQERFLKLMDPLKEREKRIDKEKRKRQFLRDIEDEKQWILERSPLANSADVGNSLQSVQMLERKNQSLQNDIDSHHPHMKSVCEIGHMLIDEMPEGDSQRELFASNIDEVQALWEDLEKDVEGRKGRLSKSEVAQQYLFDAAEAETWMSEQELIMMSEDKAHDEFAAENMLKKHDNVVEIIEEFAGTVRSLGERARELIEDEHPDSEIVGLRQSQVDKLYASLKDLCGDRRERLDGTLKLYMLQREIDDLLQWIHERELVAKSKEQGHDLEHVTMMINRFRDFARDTEHVGQERVAEACDTCDALINAGHHDAPKIAEYKDNVNEAWGDLIELIDTRSQELKASLARHKFLHDCSDTLERINEKKAEMSDELGRDAKTVASLQRRHQTFENDLISLGTQVHQIQEDAAKLVVSYSGDPAQELKNKEKEVLDAWNSIQESAAKRKMQLADASDLYRFFNLVRDLLLWTEDMIRQMKSEEKPRDVSGVELLMNNHQSLKVEIEARDENFSICVNLGKDLVARRHPRTGDVRDRLTELAESRGTMMDTWEGRWEHLQLMLEVYQFARDATVAEQWIASHEPYVQSLDTGNTLASVEAMIKKHEAFEKSAATQDERFLCLKNLTTFEVNEAEKENFKRSHPDQDYPQKTSSKEKYLKEFVPPLPTPSPKPAAMKKPHEETVSSPTSGAIVSPGAGSSQQEAAARPSEGPRPGEEVSGMLQRKHEWESQSKKSTNRSWEKLYCVLTSNSLRCFKDAKHSKLRDELPLAGVNAGVAGDYHKKPHVFRLRFPTGAHYIFHCKDDNERDSWINRINAVSGSTSTPTRTQTLPASGSAEKESKKKLFSLGRKK